MAPTIKNAKRKATKMAMPKPKVARTRAVQMSTAEVAYKRTLLDPCNCAIPQSPYGDESGTAVYREHFVYNTFNANQLFFWHPYYGLFKTDLNAGVQGITPVGAGQANLQRSERALAGCIEAVYTGVESARGGIIQCGMVPGTVVQYYMSVATGGQGATFDIGNVAQFIPNVERTPVDKCAVNWYPGETDKKLNPVVNFNAASTSLVSSLFSETHFAVIYIDNIAAGSVRLSCTSVIEIAQMTPAIASVGSGNFAWTVTSKTSPAVDVSKVIRELAEADSKWYLNTFKKVAKFGLGLVSSTLAMGLPGALSYLTSGGSGATSYGGPRNRNVGAS